MAGVARWGASVGRRKGRRWSCDRGRASVPGLGAGRGRLATSLETPSDAGPRGGARGTEGGEQMQTDQRGSAGAVEQDEDAAELASLRATCRRQAWTVETMTRVLVNLRTGLRALKAENAALRATTERASGVRRS